MIMPGRFTRDGRMATVVMMIKNHLLLRKKILRLRAATSHEHTDTSVLSRMNTNNTRYYCCNGLYEDDYCNSIQRRCYVSSAAVECIHSTTESSSSSHNINIKGTVPENGAGILAGQFAELTRSFSVADCAEFVRIVGDSNPIHTQHSHVTVDDSDEDWNANANDAIAGGNKNASTKVIVPGMLTASLFSAIFGSLIPGSIYRSQTLSFRVPIYCNESITGRIDVRRVRRTVSGGLLVFCDTRIWKEEEIGGTSIHLDDNSSDAAVLDAEKEELSSLQAYGDVDARQDCVVGKAQVW
eukprot:CAMPEP_0196824472 /NCGR_PEP_ID=MMETSP1362-20130617/91960_1 /TAXON_ID=163516 /ORGANISM="Leptocylindrus danicus, Strain CCMP1856" /LENGTH=296 /DNA_ID=CAMNT_0042204735 /DNA_START=90 /DNA_END=977 /DNA_ORIENTATION=+